MLHLPLCAEFVETCAQALDRVEEACGDPETPRIFVNGDVDRFLQRLGTCEALAADCDGTLTPGNLWGALSDLLPPHLVEEEQVDRIWYYTHRTGVDGHWWDDRAPTDLCHADAEAAWGTRSIMRARMGDVAYKTLCFTVLRYGLREGVPELFGLFEKRLVVSFGIADSIEALLGKAELTADVAGYRLTTDEHGFIIGHHPGSVVTRATKGHAIHQWRVLRTVEPRRLVTLFDSPVDKKMIIPAATSIFLVPPGDPNRLHAQFRARAFEDLWGEGVSAIYVGDSLLPLAKLIKTARART